MGYESNSIFWIEVEKVVPNPYQPRREFDSNKLKELSDSIRMYGILQPLVVTRREIIREHGAFSTEYELIAGERRLRASKLAGLAQVPVIIRSGEESDLMKLELAIIENLQREDLNAVDRALAFKQLSERFGLSHALVAQKVGRSREYVSNSIRLLNLPETILSALRVNDISDGHARTLLMLSGRPEEQDIVFREIMLKKLSVREVERIARKIATEKVRKKSSFDTDPELIEIEKQFMETLGTRVHILKTDFGGKLTIDYFSQEDLQKLLVLMHRTEATLTHRDNSSTALSRIAETTPLMSPHEIQPSEVTTPADETVPTTDENIFTRFDSLEHELSTEEIQELDQETGTRASYADTPVYFETTPVMVTIEQQTPVALPAMATVPDVVSTPLVPLVPEKKEVDDTDLYSIKNFSL